MIHWVVVDLQYQTDDDDIDYFGEIVIDDDDHPHYQHHRRRQSHGGCGEWGLLYDNLEGRKKAKRS